MDKYTFQLYSQVIRTFWRIFLVILGIALIVVLFPFVKDVLIMFIIAWLLSILLSPVVDFLESKGLKRGWAILVVMILILAIVGFSFSLIVPGIIRTVEALTSKLQSDVITDLSMKIEAYFEKNFNNAELARNVTARLNEIGVNLLNGLGEFFKNVGSFLAFVVIIPVITFFLIKDSRRFKRAIISKVPNKYFELSLNILHKVENQVGKYIQGQAVDALIVGILSTLGLFLINVRFNGPIHHFVFIGMLAGLANMIPYVGPVVGAVPALAIAILNNPPNLGIVLLWIIIMFILVQAIDNAFVSPLVVSKSVNMHPLTVIIVVIIGGKIAGPIGMLFAVPLTGIIKVTLSQVIWGLKNYSLHSSPFFKENTLTEIKGREAA
ncbi:MAG: AI-2E family transporter [Candidatus Aminicenantes bacterium]|nr:AI-2E family transporter [Candidatus Aminicenantes bacterium]